GQTSNFVNAVKAGKVLGDLLGGPNSHVTDVKTTAAGLPDCVLQPAGRPPGAPAVHAVFGDFNKDGFLDIRMQFSNPALGLKVTDKFVTLKCRATINSTSQDIITGDTVKVQPR